MDEWEISGKQFHVRYFWKSEWSPDRPSSGLNFNYFFPVRPFRPVRLSVRKDMAKKKNLTDICFVKVTYHNKKDFLKCPDNARPPEPRIQNTRRTLGRLQLHELQTCIESQVQSFIIQHQHCDLCRRHISTYAYPNQHHLQESFVQRTIKQSIWLRSRHSWEESMATY